jgi:hypothetical protein
MSFFSIVYGLWFSQAKDSTGNRSNLPSAILSVFPLRSSFGIGALSALQAARLPSCSESPIFAFPASRSPTTKQYFGVASFSLQLGTVLTSISSRSALFSSFWY